MSPVEPKLKHEIPLSGFGGQWLFVADVTGDGRCGLILHEHAAMLAGRTFAADSPKYMNWTTSEDQAQFCVTACALDGRKLWQIGRPWPHTRPYRSHGGAVFGLTHDVDGDGRQEHLFLFRDDIWVVDGASGRVKRKQNLGWDGFTTMGLAYLEGRQRPPQIWIKCDDASPPGSSYCNPLRVLAADLTPYWPDIEVPRPAHVPVARDIDGDGCDEIVHGACAHDHDGRLLWQADIPSTHVDQVILADINQDGRLEAVVALCGGGGGMVLDALTGRALWTVPRKHCGFACVGKFRDDLPGLQVCFGEDARARDSEERTSLYDAAGRRLWAAADPRAIPSALAWPSDCGPECLVFDTTLVDGLGQEILRFPVSVDVDAIARRLDRPSASGLYDWGAHVDFTACDVDGDGVEEAVFNTREGVWVFGRP